MIYAAKVDDGIVTQVVVLSEDADPGEFVVIGKRNKVGLGWTYENDEFSPPEFKEDENENPDD